MLEELDGEGILLEESMGSDMFTCHIGVVQSEEQVRSYSNIYDKSSYWLVNYTSLGS